MSDQTVNDVTVADTDENPVLDELSVLKQRAKLMGVNFSNNIGLEALRAKIQDKLEEPKPEAAAALNPLVDPVESAEPVLSLRQQQLREYTKLVRVRITNLNPNKKDLPGEIFSVSNDVIGTIAKYIPYGEVTEDGYHIPYILYLNMKDRKFLNLRTTKGKNDQITVQQNWVPEFALEVLPQLTPEELDRLRAAQAAAGGV